MGDRKSNKAERGQLLNGLAHEISAGIDSIAQMANGECYDNMTDLDMEKVHAGMFQINVWLGVTHKWLMEKKDE
jgi:hypothetical protein